MSPFDSIAELDWESSSGSRTAEILWVPPGLPSGLMTAPSSDSGPIRMLAS